MSLPVVARDSNADVRGSVCQWKHAIDPQHELPAFDRGEYVARAPQQLLARQEVAQGLAGSGRSTRAY